MLDFLLQDGFLVNPSNSIREDQGPQEKLLGEGHSSSREENKNLRSLLLISSFGALVFLSNTLWTLALLNGFIPGRHLGGCEPGANLIYSPAREAVSYELVTMNQSIFDRNPFMGKPRPEQTQAWNENYNRWRNILVSEDDLKSINRTSVQLADGSGYLAMLDVFHQLHCLDNIRMYIAGDYYITEETPRRHFEHVDHCIDLLRQSVMCHGDISLVTFDWIASEKFPFPNFHVQRECRSWDGILGWTKAHQADKSQILRPASV